MQGRIVDDNDDGLMMEKVFLIEYQGLRERWFESNGKA
jgi:hypothetical protein